MRTAAATAEKTEVKNDDLKAEKKDSGIEVVIEGEEEAKKEPAVAKKEEEKDDNADLLKRLKELERSEALAREENNRLKSERDEAVRGGARSAAEAMYANMDAIKNALGAAEAELSAAERDLSEAIRLGDVEKQVSAQKRIARADGNILRLEDGKLELEMEIERSKEEPRRQQNSAGRQEQQTVEDPIEAMPVPAHAKEWLREHEDFVSDHRKNLKLQAAHFDALDEGHKAFSTDYFISLEQHLGLRKAEKAAKVEKDDDEEDDNVSDKRATIVSAPVNRESSSVGKPEGGGRRRVTLTREQADHARISGVSEEVYAENLVRLGDLKKNGHYNERG